ncbi:hypothetical protein [Pseudooceanicola onchidii]|uniref:hypothetical protein n=1 Tax=Pseudooceanicola onchidii TaxID=2562279 RepID=UPI0010AA4A5A|nr:hypothetical protein [Pseudooceanicola onchidii]
MQWKDIQTNWEAFTPAILDRWPEAEESSVLALDGNQTDFALYLSEVTGESSRDTLAQIEDWRMGSIPTDVAMDPNRDNTNILHSDRHLGPGEEVSDRDDLFGDDNEAEPPVGRS